MTDQRQRVTALCDIIGTLQQCYVFGPEHRDSLGQAATTACMKLLSRRDQARGLGLAANLWWQAERPAGQQLQLQPAVRDGAKVRSSCRCPDEGGKGRGEEHDGEGGAWGPGHYLGPPQLKPHLMRPWCNNRPCRALRRLQRMHNEPTTSACMHA